MIWIWLSKIFPPHASWRCWFRVTYNLRIWIAGYAWYEWEKREGRL